MRFRTGSRLVVTLMTSLVFGGGSSFADDGSQPETITPAQTAEQFQSYYGWLDKFENPPRPQDARAASKKQSSQSGSEQTVPIATTQTDVKPEASPAADAVAKSSVSEVVFEADTAEPGQGLGCYYHRAYYSHLPMFQDGVYSLRGSYDVAETYHKPSEEVVSSPDALASQE